MLAFNSKGKTMIIPNDLPTSSELSEKQLRALARKVFAKQIEGTAPRKLEMLMTVTQYITDMCLNELERQGELTTMEGSICVPYMSPHMVHTVLTRQAV